MLVSGCCFVFPPLSHHLSFDEKNTQFWRSDSVLIVLDTLSPGGMPVYLVCCKSVAAELT